MGQETEQVPAQRRAGPAFTPKFLEGLKPHRQTRELFDPHTPGLALRVHPNGDRVFRTRFRELGKVVTLGPWAAAETPGHLTLAQARRWMERLQVGRQGGLAGLEAVLADLAAELEPREGPLSPTVAEVIPGFLEHLQQRRKRPHAAELEMKDIREAIGHVRLDALKKSHVVAAVDRVRKRGALSQAGRVLSLQKQLFRWAANRYDDFVSPATHIDGTLLGTNRGVARKRFLTEEELVLFLEALEKLAKRFAEEGGDLVGLLGLKLLLLTGVRPNELRLAQWHHVDLERAVWSIPPENLKMTLQRAAQSPPLVVPLAPMALEAFRQLKALGDEDAALRGSASPWVLVSRKSKSRCLRGAWQTRPMQYVVEVEPRLALGGVPTPRDLRRTLRTHVEGTLGIDWAVAERLLGHVVGSTVAQTYDRHSHLDARRKALELWDAYLHQLLHPKSNLAFLPARAR